MQFLGANHFGRSNFLHIFLPDSPRGDICQLYEMPAGFSFTLVYNISFLSLSHLCFSPDPAIVNGVYWSESLNKVFVDNFDRDPSLIWQYFGSAKGFFRQYPGEYPCIENYNSSY